MIYAKKTFEYKFYSKKSIFFLVFLICSMATIILSNVLTVLGPGGFSLDVLILSLIFIPWWYCLIYFIHFYKKKKDLLKYDYSITNVKLTNPVKGSMWYWYNRLYSFEVEIIDNDKVKKLRTSDLFNSLQIQGIENMVLTIGYDESCDKVIVIDKQLFDVEKKIEKEYELLAKDDAKIVLNEQVEKVDEELTRKELVNSISKKKYWLKSVLYFLGFLIFLIPPMILSSPAIINSNTSSIKDIAYAIMRVVGVDATSRIHYFLLWEVLLCGWVFLIASIGSLLTLRFIKKDKYSKYIVKMYDTNSTFFKLLYSAGVSIKYDDNTISRFETGFCLTKKEISKIRNSNVLIAVNKENTKIIVLKILEE